MNYVIQGDKPIVFEDYGPVDYKFGLMNVSQRHMVPAGKVDRVLLRYSFMSLDFNTVSKRLTKLLDSKSLTYDQLNQILKENF